MKTNVIVSKKPWSVPVLFPVLFALMLFGLSGLAQGKTYTLPALLDGTGKTGTPFASCNKNVTTGFYDCNTINFGTDNNVVINVTQNITLNVTGDWIAMNNMQVLANPGILTLIVSGQVSIKNSVTLIADITAGGNITIGDGGTIIGSLVSTSGTVSTGGDTTVSGTCDPPSPSCSPPRLLADYRFDQCSYNGTSGEILDSSATGAYPATSSGTRPTTQADGVVGRSLNLTSLGQYVRPNSMIPLPANYTLSFWMKVPPPAPGSNNVYVSSSLAVDGGVCRGDFLSFRSNDNYLWRVFQQSLGGVNGTYSLNSLAPGWHHFAIQGYGSTSIFQSRLLINGEAVGAVARRANGDKTTLGLGVIGTSCDEAFNGAAAQSLRMPIDEFMVWEGMLSDEQIASFYANQKAGKNHDGTDRPPPLCAVMDHYAISYPNGSTGSTCAPLTVRITAHDNAHTAVIPPAGTKITLSATPAATSWALKSGPGTFNATTREYTFAGTESAADFSMTQTAVTASINIDVTDGTYSEASYEDPPASIKDNTFQLVDASGNPLTIPTQVAGKPSSTMRLSGATCSGTSLTGDQTIDMAYECVQPATCSGSNLLRIFNAGAGTGTLIQRNNAGAALSYTPVTLTFDSNSVAQISMRFDDAGATRLHFKEGTTLGSASSITRPFGLYLAVPGNPGATTSSGTLFKKAGEDFTASVKGVTWQAVDDANGDGIPDPAADLSDNAAAPNFAWATDLVASEPITPLGGTLGALRIDNDAATIPATSYVGGTASATKVQYLDVGSFTARARVEDYIATDVDVTGNSVVVGRFMPYQFGISAKSFSHGCPSSHFTYSRQPIVGNFTLQAQNKIGGRTANYRNEFAKLTEGGLTFKNVITESTGASSEVDYTSLTATIDPENTFSNFSGGGSPGQAIIKMDYTWDMPRQPPTLSALKLSAANDGEVSQLSVLAAVDPEAIFLTTYRYGRLRLLNFNGSELLPARVEYRVEYSSGGRWTPNTADTCTSIVKENVATPGGLAVSSVGALTNGIGFITFAKAGAASYDIAVNLNASGNDTSCNATHPTGTTAANMPWLQGFWSSSCGTTPAWQQDPNARIKLGSPKAPYIFMRESY